jgi:hypothetical protein
MLFDPTLQVSGDNGQWSRLCFAKQLHRRRSRRTRSLSTSAFDSFLLNIRVSKPLTAHFFSSESARLYTYPISYRSILPDTNSYSMRRTMMNPPSSNGDVENIPNSGRGSGTKLPRLVTRNRIFSQSSNNVRVQHQYDGRIFWLMLKYDWFHLFLRCSIGQAMATLLGIWTGMILLFAAIYKAIDDNHPERNCGLAAPSETISYHGAFAFSLETCKYCNDQRKGSDLLI